MTDNTNDKYIITMREVINDTLCKEMRDRYPPQSNNNDIHHKLSLQFITFESNFLSEPKTRMLIKKHGSIIILLFHYVRELMCRDGYKVRIDDFYLTDLLENASYILCISFEETKCFIKS